MGQDIKPHILWVSRPDHVRLHTQCSNRLEIGYEDEEGGENRESEKSLAQGGAASNWEIGHYLESVASTEYRVPSGEMETTVRGRREDSFKRKGHEAKVAKREKGLRAGPWSKFLLGPVVSLRKMGSFDFVLLTPQFAQDDSEERFPDMSISPVVLRR